MNNGNISICWFILLTELRLTLWLRHKRTLLKSSSTFTCKALVWLWSRWLWINKKMFIKIEKITLFLYIWNFYMENTINTLWKIHFAIEWLLRQHVHILEVKRVAENIREWGKTGFQGFSQWEVNVFFVWFPAIALDGSWRSFQTVPEFMWWNLMGEMRSANREMPQNLTFLKVQQCNL